MGVVYEATDTRNGVKVAVKLLHEDLEQDETFRERFQREAHVAALLRSPYTVHLLDYGSEDGRYFLVMKPAEGMSPRDLLRAGPLAPAQALHIASQVARALEEAEARGVVHRDIKPANIVLEQDGTAQVLDFGIARQAGSATITVTGAFVGTLTYASPESTEGRGDHRSDLYSLGATLYHLLAGRPPFEGDVTSLLRQHSETPMPREPLGGLPAEIVETVARCLEKDPGDRYQSAPELAGVLEHLAVEAAERDDTALEVTVTEAFRSVAEADTSAVTLLLQPQRGRRGMILRRTGASYDLVLQNGGPEPVALQLEASDHGGNCEIILPELVAVAARSETTVTIAVAPRRRRWRGRTERREFRVSVAGEGGGPPLVAVGEFEDRPERLAPAVAAGGALFSFAVIALLLTFAGGGSGREDTAMPGAIAAPTLATPPPAEAAVTSPSPMPTPTPTPTPTAMPAATAAPAVVTPAPAETAVTSPSPTPTPTRRRLRRRLRRRRHADAYADAYADADADADADAYAHASSRGHVPQLLPGRRLPGRLVGLPGEAPPSAPVDRYPQLDLHAAAGGAGGLLLHVHRDRRRPGSDLRHP